MLKKLLFITAVICAYVTLASLLSNDNGLFFRLLYGWLVVLAAVSIAGLISPQIYFASRIFAGGQPILDLANGRSHHRPAALLGRDRHD